MTKDEARSAVIGAISMALKDPTLQQGFEIICKENAELKAKLNIRSCQNRRHNKACPNDGSCNHYSKWEGYENSQLEYAKTIIQDLLDNSDEYVRQRAMDFLEAKE